MRVKALLLALVSSQGGSLLSKEADVPSRSTRAPCPVFLLWCTGAAGLVDMVSLTRESGVQETVGQMSIQEA